MVHKKLRTPFFEIGAKNFMYGNKLLEVAKAADACAIDNNIDVIFIAPYTDIRMIARSTKRLLVFAPYMDTLRPGRGLADVLPEAIKDAGASGVMLNHSERQISLPVLQQTIERAKELDLITLVCAGSIAEARAVACLSPDIINPEETNLIGSGIVSDSDFVSKSTKAIKEINSNILVEHAAGITKSSQVRKLILAGADGVGSASGIFLADDPIKNVKAFISACKGG
ncbi:MAG: triose-phosphate isomerase [Defluviitaleaceae bacterium]|nr:triose-phosphate isomerase [Defluviitaleaceae bacterium]